MSLQSATKCLQILKTNVYSERFVFVAGVKSGVHDRWLPETFPVQSEGPICHSHSQIWVHYSFIHVKRKLSWWCEYWSGWANGIIPLILKLYDLVFSNLFTNASFLKSTPRLGRGTPFSPPLSVHFLIFCSLLLFPFFLFSFTLLIFLYCPSDPFLPESFHSVSRREVIGGDRT